MVVVSKPLSESSSFRLAWLTSRRNWMLSYDEATDIKWIRNLFFQVPAGDIYILSSWGSIYPSTTLLENLVFPFRFRTNLRSKLSISYSTSKKLPTRRSISSVGSGAERAAMNVPQGEPGGNLKKYSPWVKGYLCLRKAVKEGSTFCFAGAQFSVPEKSSNPEAARSGCKRARQKWL